MLLFILFCLTTSKRTAEEIDSNFAVPPMSVSVDMMKKTGSYGFSNDNPCPQDTMPDGPCGKTVWFNPASHGSNPPTFEYTFKGEKFAVYGKYDADHGKIRIYLDDEIVAEVNQYTDGEDVPYACQYLSENLPYGWHTIKVTPMNDDIELYKFAYWPSVKAVRMNSTEIEKKWNVQSDGIGGLREWANENFSPGVKKIKTLRFSKLWIYGSTEIQHGDMFLSINGYETLVNQNTSERIDNYLVYESESLPLDYYTITMSQYREDCLINCIFYIPDPQPTPEPISVSIEQMTKTGSYGSYNVKCPNDKVSETPCGTAAWFNPLSQGSNPPTFSYRFKGEMFQVYGKYDSDHGKLRVFLDDEFVYDIDQSTTGEDVSYACQYTSDVLKYGWHTIKVTPLDDDIELYKFAYWPSVHAIRVNSTEMKPLWNVQSDGIGGLREWAHENNKAGIKKKRTLRFSKIWIYGSTDINHGDMMFTLNGKEIPINENTTSRVDNLLVYESDYLPLNEYNITLSQYIEDCVLNCIFYLPFPEPTPIPISVPIGQMTITGSYGTSNNVNCPSDKVSTTPCGTTAWFNPSSHGSNPPTFSYTFKGVKFQVFGKYDDEHGTYNLYLDDELIKVVSQVGTRDTPYQLQYTSDLLKYGEHTIKITPNGDDIELYKFTYWPYLHAERLNSTEMKPLWNVESDKIGGLREWANENSHTAEKKEKTFEFSKIWIYGSKYSLHEDMLLTIDGKEFLIDEHSADRVDGALVFESEYYPFTNHSVTVSQHLEDCLLNCFYYYPFPLPEPEDYILNDDNCNLGTRCKIDNEDNIQSVQVYVDVTNFDSFKNKEDGGAIHITNAALKVNKSDFAICESEEGAGGAIYIHNTFDITNSYIIENAKFNKCSAQCGGAIYLYASSTKISSFITNCQFSENKAKAPRGTSDDKYGGSAVYLFAYDGNLYRNSYTFNSGPGGVLKVINNFPDAKSNSAKLLDSSDKKVIISDSTFDKDGKSDCALFYVAGNNGPKIELIRCKFTGSLSRNSHYIDGQTISPNAQKLVVSSCMFQSDSKKAFNCNEKNMFMSVDLKSQRFEINKWEIIYTFAIPVIGIVTAVVAAVIALKKKLNKKDHTEKEQTNEINDSLL